MQAYPHTLTTPVYDERQVNLFTDGNQLLPRMVTLADGTYIIVGQLTPLAPPVDARALIGKRRVLAGSLIGGMPETQEVLDFCAEHGVSCDTEQIAIDYLPEAMERLRRGDVRYRFVIDMASLQ